MAAWIWVLIPLAGIALGGFSEWLKFKEKHNQMGASADALADKVAELTSQNERLQSRVQNLEAIVTSESWDALSEGAMLADSKKPALSLDALDEPDALDQNEARARQMARRLRT